MLNQTENLATDTTTSLTLEMLLWVNSTPNVEPNIGFTIQDNETHMENITDEMIWFSDCGTFMMEYGVIACVICGIAFIVGVVFCLFGYRLFRATLVATGFVFGSEIVYFICVEENIFPLGGKLGLSVGAGLLCGITAVLIHYVGFFVAGFQFGLLSAIAGLILLEQGYHPFTKWIPFGVILGAGILAALIALNWQKELLILSTSCLGAGLILLSVDYFVDSSRASAYVYDRLSARVSTTALCWYSWLIIGIWPLLTSVSAVIQFCITGAKFDHREKPQVIMGIRQPHRRHADETVDNHYRQLYQIRRAHGDVISRSYMQSVQQQVAGASISLLDQTANNTPTDGATHDSLVFMTPITEIES